MAKKYNIFGFDKEGFRRDGYNWHGYDRDGFSRSGFNRDGFDRKGFDADGYDVEGFDRTGYDRYGYDREGYNRLGYDLNGYNRDGYDSKGYNRHGLDKDGFDQQGVDADGFNRQGYNRYGFDRNGYDKSGYDKEGYNKDGFNKNGYRRDGFNKNGYNIYGYDQEGYDINGYDSEKYDYSGYNVAGRNRAGYDRRGFNAQHLAVDGTPYNKNGVDYYGYDKRGFDAEGFDREGYDKTGFDRRGYGRDGYDIAGFDADGFHKNGGRYDEKGADVFGRDVNGNTIIQRPKYVYAKVPRFDDDSKYDLKGINQRGFSASNSINANGTSFDINGFGKNRIHKISRTKYWEGYDCYGFDEQGKDRAGYDKDGYNSSGWNREGYNRIGGYYDKNGYDWHGYDKYGLDSNGVDRRGITISGLDSFGFNLLGSKMGFDRNGKKLSLYDSSGINVYTLKDASGFFRNGFDSEGYNRQGLDIDGYDRQGYGVDGFNRQGYNRDGFNLDGFDQDGFDKNGFDQQGFNHLGYDSSGYNRDGFDQDGFSRTGYDKDGFNILGFNMSGYDREGFDSSGKDRNGETREQVSKRIEANKKKHELRVGMIVYHRHLGRGEIVGFRNNKATINIDYDNADSISSMGVDKFWECNTFGDAVNEIERARSFDSDDDADEKNYFKIVCNYIEEYSESAVRTMAEAESARSTRCVTYVENGEIVTGSAYEDPQVLAVQYIQSLKSSPYFCHISYSSDERLYIGKKGYPKYIVDWADPKASLYYQYQMYIGQTDVGLKLVRDVDIENGYYLGYRDIFNLTGKGDNSGFIKGINDEHLNRVIASNREDKHVHDIIQTIQNNQYNIITTDKRKNVLVLGCAGSGKTMILLHKIRYMKYNDKSLDMKKVIVISPTNLLEHENRELARILQVADVQQETMTSMILSIAVELLKSNNCPSFLQSISDADNNRILYNIRSYTELDSIRDEISHIINDSRAQYEEKENQRLLMLIAELGSKKCGPYTVTDKYEEYKKCLNEFEKYSKKEIEHIVLRATRMYKKSYELKMQIELLEFLLSLNVFAETSNRNSSISLYNTLALATQVDIPLLKQYVTKTKCTSFLSLMQNIMPFVRENIESTRIERIMDELKSASVSQINAKLKILYKELEVLKAIPHQIDILSVLNKENRFIGNGFRTNIADDEVLSCGKHAISLLDSIEWVKENDTHIDLFEKYDVAQKRLERFHRFSRGEVNQYLLDIVLDELDILRDLRKTTVNVTKNNIFEICYILSKLFSFSSPDERYIFIDEFQDFPKEVLLFIKSIYPNSFFNLFGDFNQCINDSGMTSANSASLDDFSFEKYEIQENYRNSKDITNYINNRFSMNMLPIGLKGLVEEREKIELPKLNRGDRAAIIVANNKIAKELYTELCQGKNKTMVFEYTDEYTISRKGYTILPVLMAKGLEFEKVISYEAGMTENQKYVASTRAIDYLQVIK